MGSYLLYEEERAREEVYTLLSRQAVLNAQAIQRKVSPDELRRETVKRLLDNIDPIRREFSITRVDVKQPKTPLRALAETALAQEGEILSDVDSSPRAEDTALRADFGTALQTQHIQGSEAEIKAERERVRKILLSQLEAGSLTRPLPNPEASQAHISAPEGAPTLLGPDADLGP